MSEEMTVQNTAPNMPTMKGGVLVEYGGIAYQPYAYELKFQQDGKIKHTAILKETKANCLVYCRLEDVKEK